MPPELIEAAREALHDSYTPYSEYAVGAAIETGDGDVFTGCNIEVSNYSNSIHAEEAALAGAIVAGHRTFERLAVSSGPRDGITPCGMCRQTLFEFCDADLPVLCDEGTEVTRYPLGDLLPAAMGPATLSK